jgi:hypothetical protein
MLVPVPVLRELEIEYEMNENRLDRGFENFNYCNGIRKSLNDVYRHKYNLHQDTMMNAKRLQKYTSVA